jgi:hypothetical protein
VKGKSMSKSEHFQQKIRDEFVKFERTMEELHFLRQVAQDLKNFREMIKLKKYD